MTNRVNELLSKLDSLKEKKEELVKERDLSKKEAEEVKTKLGFDLIAGMQIDKAGENFTKANARIETLNSAINAVASTCAKVEEELRVEQKEQALKDVKELGEEADSLALSLINRLGEIALEAKKLSLIEDKARSLSVGSSGFSMRHNTGRTIREDIFLLFAGKLRNIHERIPELMLQIK